MAPNLIDRDVLIATIRGMPVASPGAYVKRDDAFAAMCMIEEMVDPIGQLPDAPNPWTDWRDQVGINELREFVITTLAPAVNAAWDKAYAAYEAAVSAEVAAAQFDPGAFDYDFIPSWLRVAVKWDDPAGPRVLGK